jgi:hypothetical protein
MKVFRRALALFAACFIVSCGSKSSENRDSNGEINGSVGAGGGLPHPVGSGGSFGSSDSDAGPPSLHPEFDWTVDGGAVCYPTSRRRTANSKMHARKGVCRSRPRCPY